uniref:BTB domain-containing protein n=1 Tax=Aegilops tauschii subsp. strangulata TaxID=200361 RepID=A0A453SXP0_AEGTS
PAFAFALNGEKNMHLLISCIIHHVRSDGHGAKKWQSTDAGIQSHESISDILVLLEGVLQTKNVSVLIQAADVSSKLVSSIGNSIRQYPILEIVSPLSCQLSAHQLPTAISCARAMNCILNSLVTARGSTHAEILETLERTNAVASIVSALQSYTPDVHPLSYLTEMISLLRTILWIWPSSRYHVWSNGNLMGKLAHYCLATETTVVAKVLRLYAALALCGHGAMILLKNKVLMAKICELVGTSHPSSTRIEAFKLCHILLRSSKGCSQLMTSRCQPIVEGIIDAMRAKDDKLLVTEGCRTALLVLRYAGNHHQCFWSNAIDKVLYSILTGRCLSSHQSDKVLCDDELFDMVSKNFMDIHPYVWDILGYLVVHCTEDHHPVRKGKGHSLHALISCACLLATDVMRKSSPMTLSKDVQEPALRAVLMMLLSPNGYIQYEASFKLSEGLPYLGDGYLNVLLSSLESNTTRSVATSFDSFKIMTNLMNLACLVLSRPYHNLLNKRNPIDVLSIIIKECLHNNIHITRDQYTEDFLIVLQRALSQSLSSGPKLYIAHILSLFGLCGSPSKLGGKMSSALDNNDLADLELLLSDGESINAHTAIISARCPKLLPSVKCLLGSDEKVKDEWGKSVYRVQMSDRVDSHALKKILEYTYTGFVMVGDDIVKPVRTLAKYCHLKPLAEMLQKEQPRWNSDYTRYDLTVALGPVEHSFSDIILEAQSNEEMKCDHGPCQLSTPHVHSHKTVLIMSCDYLRALFRSGMHESFSDVIRVPLGWQALDKLVHWFYSGELPSVALDCRWNNLSSDEQRSHLNAYAELSSLAEFWFLEGVKEESLSAASSLLGSSTSAAAVEFVAFAANLGQWEMVEAGVRSVAHLYPRLRDSGRLERLDEELLNMLRTEYVRYSQHGGGGN